MKTTKSYWKPSWTWLISWGLIDRRSMIDQLIDFSLRTEECFVVWKIPLSWIFRWILIALFPTLHLPYLAQKAEFWMQTLPHQLHRQVSFTVILYLSYCICHIAFVTLNLFCSCKSFKPKFYKKSLKPEL